VQKLREELCFASPEELRAQIGKDIQEVETLSKAKGLLKI